MRVQRSRMRSAEGSGGPAPTDRGGNPEPARSWEAPAAVTGWLSPSPRPPWGPMRAPDAGGAPMPTGHTAKASHSRTCHDEAGSSGSTHTDPFRSGHVRHRPPSGQAVPWKAAPPIGERWAEPSSHGPSSAGVGEGGHCPSACAQPPAWGTTARVPGAACLGHHRPVPEREVRKHDPSEGRARGLAARSHTGDGSAHKERTRFTPHQATRTLQRWSRSRTFLSMTAVMKLTQGLYRAAGTSPPCTPRC